jgi:transposase InsO family protein
LAQIFSYPDGSQRKVPERTVRHWLGRYRKHGFKGLFDDFRSDKGANKIIPEELLQKAVALRKEEPARSVRTIIEILKNSGEDSEQLRARTLARRLTEKGATKKLLKKGIGTYERWEQLHVNDLWHGDTSHGIWLRDPENPIKAKKTKFIVFVDDASRVCTHGEFYFDEQLPRLLDCFGKALLKRGLPCRMLFDNAFIYHSTSMATMCAELGTEISFCRPRAPQGKGKVERFIKTVQDSFMVEANRAGVDSLAVLNEMFRGWLDGYHNRIHSELNGLTPLDRWKQDLARVSAVTQSDVKRALMLRAKRKVHINTATVSVDGQDYQASPDLAGQEVEVRWHPQDTDSVELWMLGEFIETAPRFQIKPFTESKNRLLEPEDAPGTPVESSKRLMLKFQDDSSDEPSNLVKGDDLLACSEFVKLLRDTLERELVQEELDMLGRFFSRLAPFRRAVIADTLERCAAVKGTDLHLRYYLEQLEQALKRR